MERKQACSRVTTFPLCLCRAAAHPGFPESPASGTVDPGLGTSNRARPLPTSAAKIHNIQKNHDIEVWLEEFMKHLDLPLARRSLIKGAGLGLGAGMVGALAGATAAPQAAAAATPEGGEIWSSEYWTKKGDIPLWMFRKRVGAPKAGEPSRPVLFFVHGSSVTSRSFDLNVPGHGEYSVMNEFARYGFDCWTMDHENYGKSGRTSGNSDIASGVEDLKAAVEVVARETGRQKYHFLGESSGALRAGAYAMVAPERADRLVLAAFTYKGEGSPTLTKRAEQVDYYRTHNMRKRDREMIRSIATRDKPGTSDAAAVEALADAEMPFGDQIPTGTYLDMTANLPVVHPQKVQSPVLLVRGEFDGIATVADLEEFFNLLPNGDRQFIILPGTAHSVALATNRQLFWHVTRAFLTMPTPIAT
jgi:pimeloyl-ACP methyl ester carboxylesterase